MQKKSIRQPVDIASDIAIYLVFPVAQPKLQEFTDLYRSIKTHALTVEGGRSWLAGKSPAEFDKHLVVGYIHTHTYIYI